MPVNNTILIRKGTDAQWSGVNPVLASGEAGYDLTNNILKIGDGITSWNNLTNHKHTTANITNFNSSVSGLLPSITGSGYVNSSFNNNTYTINVTGLQPSGNYSLVGHTHTSDDITNFNSSVSGLLPVTNILAGSNIGVSTSGSVFTVAVTGQLGLTTEEVDDRVSNLLAAGSYVNLNYDDLNNNLTISVTGLQPSGDYSLVGHTHTANDITDFNSSVSGLIPVKHIVSGTDINVTSVSGIYTINSTVNTASEAGSLVTTVFNKTGSPIPKMSAVYINGGQGDIPTISLAVATGDSTSAGTYGVTFENIPNMSTGKVVVFGRLTGLDTDQFNPAAPTGNVNGQVLYLSPSVSGSLTLTKPSAPNHIVAIGTVVRTHQNEGVIEVRVQNGFELEELHNVAISGVANGQFLQYNSSSQLWVPSSSGNFNTLSINGTGVSVDGHTHNSIIIYSNSYDINALNISGINYTYIFNIGAENSSLILPTAINNKNIYTLKNNTNSSIYFKTSDSQTIDGYSPSPPPSGTVIGLNIRYSSITVVSDNNNWIIV